VCVRAHTARECERKVYQVNRIGFEF
jgi:hypothetical protein